MSKVKNIFKKSVGWILATSPIWGASLFILDSMGWLIAITIIGGSTILTGIVLFGVNLTQK